MSALILGKEIMTKLNLLQLVVTSMTYFDIFMYKILRLSFSITTVSFYNLSGKIPKTNSNFDTWKKCKYHSKNYD